MKRKIKCFLGFHKPSATAELNTWTGKSYSVCIYCGKEFEIKYPPDKTTQLSGLTDYELYLEGIVDKIKSEPSCLLCINILKGEIHKCRKGDIYEKYTKAIYNELSKAELIDILIKRDELIQGKKTYILSLENHIKNN
jgi:hypothetical protein